jgi:hypothetical protein
MTTATGTYAPGLEVLHISDEPLDAPDPGRIERVYVRDGQQWARVAWPAPVGGNDHPVDELIPAT